MRRISYAHHPLQAYANRENHWHAIMDDATFEALNDGGEGLPCMFAGNIDALDEMPAGSHKGVEIRWPGESHTEHLLYPTTATRGMSLAETQERERRMFEILSTED